VTPGIFLAVATTIAVAAVTPGPAVTALVARTIADGPRPAMALNAGIVTGDLLFFALAAAGMAAAAQALGGLFAVLQWAGAAYLAWQGFRLWRYRPQPPPVDGTSIAHQSRFWSNYGAGLLLMFGHVQAILFYAALLPGLVDLRNLALADAGLVMLLLAVIIGGVNTGYIVLATRARGFFADQRAQRMLHRAAGSLMLLAAVLVAAR
jgi:threonine/homoserine/homoserine lactone efflux protein